MAKWHGWLMLGRSVFWALFIGSAVGGVGGMSIMGAGASDDEISRLWRLTGLLAGITMVIAFVIFTWRAKKQRPPT